MEGVIREFKLKGLNCANCAKKIEKKLGTYEHVAEVRIDLVREKLVVKTDAVSDDELFHKITETVHMYEPDVFVSFMGSETAEENAAADEKFRKLIPFAIGFPFYALALLKLFNPTVTLALYIAAYGVFGFNVFFKAFRNLLSKNMFDENLLMSISTIGAFLIGEFPEAVAVMLFFRIGTFFEDMQVNKSRAEISSLMDIKPTFARVLRQGIPVEVDPLDVRVSDLLLVKPGEKFPVDGMVMKGSSEVDLSQMTGESVPVRVRPDDAVLSGTVNISGALTIRCEKLFVDSSVSKVLEMIEHATEKKSKTEHFITRFARYYTPIVVLLAVIIAIFPPLILRSYDFADWVRRGLIFLVVSCPCALVVSVPLTFFSAIGQIAKQGILIKGSQYVSALANVFAVAFDKTGTLTKGVFAVSDIFTAEHITSDALLESAAIAESKSNHPIAKAITNAYEGEIMDAECEELSGMGVRAQAGENIILVGNDKLMKQFAIPFIPYEGRYSVSYVARNNEFLGYIVVSDTIRNDALHLVEQLKNVGVKRFMMLSGDRSSNVSFVAEKLQITETYAELLPHEKVSVLERIIGENRESGATVFIGDGINDSPSLKLADIGISMGISGADSSIEASDVVFMTDEPSKLVTAIKMAKSTQAILWQNIIFALGVKLLVLSMAAFGIATMWEAVFADVGVSVLAVCNAMRKKI